MTRRKTALTLRALQCQQGEGQRLYSFFVPGHLITHIADISRVSRDEEFSLSGFQRKAIQTHIQQIAEYLNQAKVLFPNAIILAFGPEVEFKKARGRAPSGIEAVADAGTLTIPIRREGERIAWIVDGQQRSLALAQSKNRNLPVPVVGFLAPDLNTQREQFILVNKARPLPTRLINELLPEVDTRLPRDLSARKVPAEVCKLLHKDPNSPFHDLIRFHSQPENKNAVVTDSALIEAIRASMNNPLGALAQFRAFGDEPADIQSMYDVLVTYWSCVAEVFPEAWGRPPTKSRLMHGAGIKAMGILMDHMMPRVYGQKDPAREITASLGRMSDSCAWTAGVWPDIGYRWNQIQNTSRHVKELASQLVRLDYEATRQQVQ